MKTLLKYKWLLLSITLIIIVIWLCPKGCDFFTHVENTINHDTIYKKESKVDLIIAKVLKERSILRREKDSLLARKPIYVIRYKTKFDSLIIADTSCQNSLIMLYNSFGELNNINNIIIAQSDSIHNKDSILISTLFDKVKNKQDMRNIDSTYISDSIPIKIKQAYKQGLKKGRKQGFVAGAVVVEAANIGTKLISKD